MNRHATDSTRHAECGYFHFDSICTTWSGLSIDECRARCMYFLFAIASDGRGIGMVSKTKYQCPNEWFNSGRAPASRSFLDPEGGSRRQVHEWPGPNLAATRSRSISKARWLSSGREWAPCSRLNYRHLVTIPHEMVIEHLVTKVGNCTRICVLSPLLIFPRTIAGSRESRFGHFRRTTAERPI